jgi:hypothetical protein
MLVLDPVLEAAQSLQSRYPLIEIMMVENTPSIPFTGDFIDTIDMNVESHPALRTHSSGSLALAFTDIDTYLFEFYINYVSTDTNRTMWGTYNKYMLGYGGTNSVSGLDLCELVNGDVGILFLTPYAGTQRLKRMVIPVGGGTPVVAVTQISNEGVAIASGPSLIRLQDDSYLTVYVLLGVDGHYHLYYRTSTDFATWSAATEIDDGVADPSLRKGNPYLIQITTGQIFLWFDRVDSLGTNGEELANIYYCTSDASPISFSTAAKWSNYTAYGVIGKHPAAVQKVNGKMYVVFDEIRTSLTMNALTPGWIENYSYVRDMHYNPATGKLYVVNSTDQVGAFPRSVIEIDTVDWRVSQSWSINTTPALHVTEAGGWNRYHGAGPYVVVGQGVTGAAWLDLVNGTANTITHYYFYAAGGHAANVSWDPHWTIYNGSSQSLYSAFVDITTSRIYCLFVDNYVYAGSMQVGYLDIADPGPSYSFTVVWSALDIPLYGTGELENQGAHWNPDIYVFPSDSIIVLNFFDGAFGKGGTVVLAGGLLWKTYSNYYFGDYPIRGLSCVQYYNGKLYGGVRYQNTDDDINKRGLCIIDLASDTITFSRPSWASVDDYNLFDVVMTEDNKMLFTAGYNVMTTPSGGYGVALYDPAGDSWSLFDNDTNPGLTPNADEGFYLIDYDPVTHMIYTTLKDLGYVVAFDRDGAMKQSQYSIGTFTTSWSWAAPSKFVIGRNDFNAVVALDPVDGGIYSVWDWDSGVLVYQNQTDTDLSMKWAKEVVSFDLSPFIVRNVGVTVHESVDGSPTELTFTLSNGHLFDQHNIKSLWRSYLRKVRKLTLKLGEKVAGVDYWSDQGIFYVSEAKMKGYAKGEYPVMDMVARDERELWEQTDIKATPYYDGAYPETVIGDLLYHYADKIYSDVSLPVFDNRTKIWIQFIDKSLKACLDEIGRRYGYYIFPDTDGLIKARKITDLGAPVITYTDSTKLLKWTPDYTYSDYTNQVIVTGEERDYIEVLLEERRVASINASHRWNTGEKNYYIWYSADRTLKVRNPRMVVLDSVTSLAFDLSGKCSETLVNSSQNNTDASLRDKYCVIVVSSPDLTYAFIAGLVALSISIFTFDVTIGIGGGPVIPIGRIMTVAALMICLNILSATGNFFYEVWGMPVSTIRRTVQSDALLPSNNDLAFQQDVGRVVTKYLTDALCYSPADCNVVAAYELMWVMRQRARVTLEKIVDLRLQAADKVQLVHPFSLENITVFVTDRKRTVKQSEQPGGSGEYQDSIEGWVIS